MKIGKYKLQFSHDWAASEINDILENSDKGYDFEYDDFINSGDNRFSGSRYLR